MAGLSTREAVARLARFGPNALPQARPDALWKRFLHQFRSPLIAILLFALAFEVALWLREVARGEASGVPIEALTIAVILIFNAGLELLQEHRSEAALARLEHLAAAHAWAVRDGALVRVPAAEVVPGDRLRIEAGNRVPADGALADTHGVALDESLLTGESLPIERGAGEPASSGTLVVRGQAYLDVERTGSASSMGRLAGLLHGIESGATPLERRVDELGRRLARWVGLAALGLVALGIAAEGLSNAPQAIVFAIALAVAAVPEGLPAVMTVALALGVERMARRGAIVRRLAAVEALGSVTVIATDKTGTLTENRMDVRALDAVDEDAAVHAMVLASDADPASAAGDPLELGLLREANRRGVDAASLRARSERVDARAFDSAWKFARATVRDPQVPERGETSWIKGAPEELLARAALSPAERRSWSEKADAYAGEGYRVLALARGQGRREENLEWLGLVMLWDAPRAEVPGAVAAARAAGVRVIMLTGDHPATALAVAHAVGIPGPRVVTGADLESFQPSELAHALREADVFARVRPEQKLGLVEALQASGEIVAVTGDGVNDAPALKRSDVGVAMGQRGSEVSREVSDLILSDDNFATIVAAIEEGRGIWENIQKFLRFLFSTNLSEVLVVALGATLAFALGLRDAAGALLVPLTAAQILWINLVTDGPPALALAFDRTPGTLRAAPRPPGAPLLDAHSLRFILAAGSVKALIALAILGLVPRLGYGVETARATAFHFLAIGQLLFTFPARHTRIHPLPNTLLLVAVTGGIAVQVAAATLPFTARALGNIALPSELWLAVLAAAGASWALAELTTRILWRAAAK